MDKEQGRVVVERGADVLVQVGADQVEQALAGAAPRRWTSGLSTGLPAAWLAAALAARALTRSGSG